MRKLLATTGLALALIGSNAAHAQDAKEGLKLYFDTAGATIDAEGAKVLDQAARLFRDGNPIVMIVSGGADTVGLAERNLTLSIRRAIAVADGLTARGIPADRLQVLGRGESELNVRTGDEAPNPENRVAVITWR